MSFLLSVFCLHMTSLSSKLPTTTTAVVLFAHGSRDPLWRAPIEAIAHHIASIQPGHPVACAYLELCPPDLPTAVHGLLSHGITHVRVLPVFFGMGQHARHDLPALLAQLRQIHPNVQFTLLPPAGEHPALTALLAHMALDSLGS
jgi:sirohydrochlorin cobaltochelatase